MIAAGLEVLTAIHSIVSGSRIGLRYAGPSTADAQLKIYRYVD